MTLALLGAVLSLCLLPSLLFLGLWHGLHRMQRHPLVARSSERAGYTDPAVTWRDVIDAYADPRNRGVVPPAASQSASARDEHCSLCGTDNDRFATFCRTCCRKLE